MKEGPFKAYITAQALTKGIQEKMVRRVSPTVVNVEGTMIYYRADEWWVSRENAVVQAEDIRLNRIDSLKRQIEKLEKMKFE